ncbi:MAG: hypothetical protein ACUVSH_11175, partial [Anaerolineae bacterium]
LRGEPPMIHAEIRKYVTTPLFWILNAIGIVLLLIQSVVLFAAHQVGLLSLTVFDYLVGTVNLYFTSLLPFLFSFFAAYTYVSELQWRTLMFPFFDGIPRRAWLAGKAVLIGVSLLIFTGLYLLLALGIGGGLFPFDEIYLENHRLLPGEAILRVATGTLWISFILYPFGLLALLLSILTRNLLVGGLGGSLAFFASMIFQQSPYNPLRLLFAVAQQLVRIGELATPGFLNGVGQATALNLGLIIFLAAALYFAFDKGDIVLE